MASSKKTPDGGHIIDVSRPGKAAPSSTSKPVIVTNRPILKDPMMVAESEDDESKPSDGLMRKTAPSLKPVELPVPEADKAADEAKPAEPEAPSDEMKTVESKTLAPAATEEAPSEPSQPAPAEAAPVEVADSAGKGQEGDKPADGKDEGAANPEAMAQAEADKRAAHEQEVQKLVDAKQYFLPINSIEKRKSRHFVILGVLLSLVLAAVWTDVALDAGLISIPGIKPVTHFFSN